MEHFEDQTIMLIMTVPNSHITKSFNFLII